MTEEQKKKKNEYEKQQLIKEMEQMPSQVVSIAYLYAINYTLYGIDITKNWETATQQHNNLEAAYYRGYMDGQKEAKDIQDTPELEDIKAEICDKICKYPDNWDEETQGQLCESEHCANCPLNRL